MPLRTDLDASSLETHAGYAARQAGQCRYVWRTPHGRYHLVDHAGTRAIPAGDGDLILRAPQGVDLYPEPPGRRFELDPAS